MTPCRLRLERGHRGPASLAPSRPMSRIPPCGIAIDLAGFDLALMFPPNDADVPTTQHLVGTRCVVACVQPVSTCGS